MGSVIVIGAGISGLTAAHVLHGAGHQVIVLDQRAHPGGRMHSERIAGFLMEHGPNTIVSPAPKTEGLIEELGLSRERIDRGEGVRSRYLVRDGLAHTLPLEPHRFFFSSFFSLSSRLRMLMEPFVSAQPGDETIANFARRRFGREFLDYVMDPLVGGLYAGDPEQLSVSAVFPQLKRLECNTGSVVRGVIESGLSRARGGYSHPANRMLFSFRQGLGALPGALVKQLSGRVFLGHRVEGIHRRAGGSFRVRVRRGSDVSWLAADSVVLALPAYAAARVLERFEPGATQVLAQIAHPPLAVVFLGYRRESISHPLDGLGVLAPAIEKRNVLGMLFSSTLFAGRAPAGHVAITAFAGGARQPELVSLPPDALQALVHAEVMDLLGARAAPIIARTRYWRYGLPQPGVDHAERIQGIRSVETEYPGLFLTGNYFSGVSTTACVEQAFVAAQRANSYLSDLAATGRARVA